MSRRILMVNDIANTAAGLRTALESAGWTVDRAAYPLRGDVGGAKLLAAQLRFALGAARASRAYDALHIHYGHFGLAGRLSPRPYVLHCHGTDLRANLKNKYRRLTLAALRGAARILYATPDLAQYLPEWAADKAAFCPNIVDLEAFTPLTPSAPPSVGGRVLFISKLDPTKGMETMPPAIAALCESDKVSAVSLFGFGKSPEFPALPESPKLTVLSKIPYAEMPDVIRRHDVIIGQVKLGAIGMSELEAMACGRPVVAHFTYDAAYPEPAPLVHAQTTDEVAAAALDLLANPARAAALGQAARAWIETYHSPAAASDLLTRTFSDVLGLNILERSFADETSAS